jgi:hypothetical protein
MSNCSKGWANRCGHAKGKRCTCACGGENHGVVHHQPQSQVDEGAVTSALFEPFEKLALETTPTCRWCGAELHGPVQAYPHEGGWIVRGMGGRTHEGRWWLYIKCPKCAYDWALWRLGVPREWTPAKAA